MLRQYLDGIMLIGIPGEDTNAIGIFGDGIDWYRMKWSGTGQKPKSQFIKQGSYQYRWCENINFGREK